MTLEMPYGKVDIHNLHQAVNFTMNACSKCNAKNCEKIIESCEKKKDLVMNIFKQPI
jgi:hypothetical protein